ncbi:hypothetical protein J7438_09575 [Thalassotalea sp. G20_0]|uniref:hypothetical protein n=1 Tax=Thalassotalea sp. G20_0 TaxID=2821093 RepID=UPI001ADCB9E8|nr:hypothetical protein [Thalassotalea sp. G20_0]MBO9494332.1 hypothetical protein [Thalassotalea sp. G20_0]
MREDLLSVLERRSYQRAYQKVYRQSLKWKTYQKAYHQSEERKAYRKAYNQVLKDTGDKEQAKISGKQASNFVTESKKQKIISYRQIEP